MRPVALACAVIGIGACGGTAARLEAAPAMAPHSTSAAYSIGTSYSKVLVIVEENKTHDQLIGSTNAPYVNELAATYASAAHMDAGYPTHCKSLGGYLLLTSGDRHNVCDNRPPAAHRIAGDSIFGQVARSGRQWRTYAESMPGTCALRSHRPYVVKHTPAAYYVDIRDQCERWQIPMGSLSSGAFHDDLSSGRLPAYSMVIPDQCNDMHGDHVCAPSGKNQPDPIAVGDAWLREVMAAVLASPDYQAGRLVVMINWDEGDRRTNHIPTLVISPSTKKLVVREPLTQCSMLALVQDLLALPRLGCAAGEPRRLSAFGLGW